MNDVFKYKEKCTIVSPDVAKIIGINEPISDEALLRELEEIEININ